MKQKTKLKLERYFNELTAFCVFTNLILCLIYVLSDEVRVWLDNSLICDIIIVCSNIVFFIWLIWQVCRGRHGVLNMRKFNKLFK
jgi:hypothetical protein